MSDVNRSTEASMAHSWRQRQVMLLAGVAHKCRRKTAPAPGVRCLGNSAVPA